MADNEKLIKHLRKVIEEATADLNAVLPPIEIEQYLELERRVKAKKPEPKYATGIGWLDRNLNGGFTRGSFINLAGVSFAGKSTLALKILTNIAEYKEVVFFSLEMYENILVQELEKKLNDRQKQNLLIVQKGYHIENIEKVIREKAKQGVHFFAIDSKMKVRTDFEGKEYQQISKLSNMFARLTQELGIILLLINQINEEDRKNNKFGLKGSGDQVYDSDVILYINIKIVEGKERRICDCVKDRYNKKRWSFDITEVDQHEYNDKLDMAKI